MACSTAIPRCCSTTCPGGLYANGPLVQDSVTSHWEAVQKWWKNHGKLNLDALRVLQTERYKILVGFGVGCSFFERQHRRIQHTARNVIKCHDVCCPAWGRLLSHAWITNWQLRWNHRNLAKMHQIVPGPNQIFLLPMAWTRQTRAKSDWWIMDDYGMGPRMWYWKRTACWLPWYDIPREHIIPTVVFPSRFPMSTRKFLRRASTRKLLRLKASSSNLRYSPSFKSCGTALNG